MSLVPHDGTSRFAAMLLRTVRGERDRDRPELSYGTIVDGGVQPDDWSGRPLALQTAEARIGSVTRRAGGDDSHWGLINGDRVVVGWVAGHPWVVGRLSSDQERWWPTDQYQHDLLVERVNRLEQRVSNLEAAFSAHLAGHP